LFPEITIQSFAGRFGATFTVKCLVQSKHSAVMRQSARHACKTQYMRRVARNKNAVVQTARSGWRSAGAATLRWCWQGQQMCPFRARCAGAAVRLLPAPTARGDVDVWMHIVAKGSIGMARMCV